MMSSKNEDIVQTMVRLHQKSNFIGILQKMEAVEKEGSESDKTVLKSLLWPIPTANDFDTLIKLIHSRQISKTIFSVGCGTGLLEYLLLEFLCMSENPNIPGGEPDYRVIGIEVDSLWWQSKYAPPLFLNVLYVGENFSSEETFGEPNSLALFSYFNNLQVFTQYLKAFKGNYIGIIGPVQTNEEKKITQFCAPNPMDLKENKDLPTSEWELVLLDRFGLNEMDYIGIYSKLEF